MLKINMLSVFRSKENLLIAVYSILFLVGISIHSTSFLFHFALTITEVFLFITSLCLILFTYYQTKNKSFPIFIIICFSFTFVLEMIGVITGDVFGDYNYTDFWKVQLHAVPVVIGLNWVCLLLASASMATSILNEKKPYLTILLGGFLITFMDFFIEIIAIRFNYWQWNGNSVPIQNYIAWFLIGTLMMIILQLLRLKIKTRLLNAFYIINLVFFISLILLVKS